MADQPGQLTHVADPAKERTRRAASIAPFIAVLTGLIWVGMTDRSGWPVYIFIFLLFTLIPGASYALGPFEVAAALKAPLPTVADATVAILGKWGGEVQSRPIDHGLEISWSGWHSFEWQRLIFVLHGDDTRCAIHARRSPGGLATFGRNPSHLVLEEDRVP